jgi:hypothetical protein
MNAEREAIGESIDELVKELPPEMRQEVVDFVEFLLAKQHRQAKGQMRLDWRGLLSDLRDQYTSVELQHKALEWWGD